MKKQYSVERLEEILDELKKFNSEDLSQIELLEGGKPLNIGPETLKEWSYVGMSNKAFVEMRFWENKFDDSTLFS